MSWQDLWNFQSIEFVCAKSFRARHLIKCTKELNFKHIKRSTNICEQAENWDRDFWQMNFCSNICKKNFVKFPTSPERGPQLKSLSYFNLLSRQNPFFFTPFFLFWNIFENLYEPFFLFKIGFMGVPNMPSLSDRSLPCLASPLASALVKTYLKWP